MDKDYKGYRIDKEDYSIEAKYIVEIDTDATYIRISPNTFNTIDEAKAWIDSTLYIREPYVLY